MISGDASNANFASTLVAESPFVKARECDQGFYKRHDSDLLWKVLRLAWENGSLKGSDWPMIRQSIEIKIDAPEVASRDKEKQAGTDEILQRMGVKSRRTIAAEHDLDLDEELRNMADDGDPTPMPENEEQQMEQQVMESLIEAGCGTGDGGFQSGNDCSQSSGKSKTSKAKKKTAAQRKAASIKAGILNKKGKLTPKGIRHIKRKLKGKVSPEKIDTIIQRSGLLEDIEEDTLLSSADQGAIVGAMESVTTLEEARQILREYP